MKNVFESVQGLREVAPTWEARGVEDRLRVLQAWAAEVRNRRADLREALSRDTGRAELSDMEIDFLLSSVTRQGEWAPLVLAGEQERRSSNSGVTLTEASVPLGVVGVISPWNFPLQLAMIDAVPALLMGCPVIVKPTEMCPEFVKPLRETVAAVPELSEVLVFVEGGPDVGEAIVRSVDVVCFTGSVATGRRVAAAAAEAFIPAFLELGGKDAAIVAEGADIDMVAAALVWGGTANTGQSCMSIERVYAQDSISEDLVDALVAKAETIGLEGVDQGGQIGPFIDPRQASVVQSHIDEAVVAGAVVRCGGTVETHQGRPYLRPTVLTGVDHSMAVMTEETFGPVIPVMPFTDMEEAVTLANSTRYGLSGAVFGPPEVARSVARRMQAGGISINDVLLTGLVPEGEKQAFKDSGMGPTRMGPGSLRRFRRQRVLLNRNEPAHQPWWYR